MLDIFKLIKKGDAAEIAQYMKEHDLIVEDGKIVAKPEKREWVKSQVTFWDQRQQARKILLNSLYGALLNEALRFADERMGQSVTLTGRSIVRHMNAQCNMEITGNYDYRGDAICYADTDSCYFSAAYLLPEHTTREQYIELYDAVADNVNATFPEFMARNFNTSLARGAIIAAGRELVASKILFIKKKKYGGLIYDLEGKRFDVGSKQGKLKAMGLDLKRADTPKFMQEFLEKLLMDVLTGVDPDKVISDIRDFRQAFKSRPAWEKGSPKKVSNLTKYNSAIVHSSNMNLFDRRKKGESARLRVPSHVLSSLNWNKMLEMRDDKFSMRITDGSRIIVCKLMPNSMKVERISYPMDEPRLPQWFKELPFDHAVMEETIIDKKIDNLLGVLDWPLQDSKIILGEEFFQW